MADKDLCLVFCRGEGTDSCGLNELCCSQRTTEVVVGWGGSLTPLQTSYKRVHNSVLKEPGHPEVTGASDALQHKTVTKNTVYDP